MLSYTFLERVCFIMICFVNGITLLFTFHSHLKILYILSRVLHNLRIFNDCILSYGVILSLLVLIGCLLFLFNFYVIDIALSLISLFFIPIKYVLEYVSDFCMLICQRA